MEAPLELRAQRVFTPWDEVRDGAVVCEDGKISFVGAARDAPQIPEKRVVNLGDCALAPGFVDLHVHGGGGHWWGQSAEANLQIARRLAASGTTSCLASLGGRKDFNECLDAVARTSEIVGVESQAAQVLGIHMEGPFLSVKRRGAWMPEQLRAPDQEDFAAICTAAGSTLRTMTVAPELDGVLPLIRRAAERGVRVAIGHSDASYEQALAVIGEGVTMATHTFNAMRGLHHRDPGIVGAILASPEVDAELIADGQHVAEGAIRVLLATRPAERVLLVTDNVALAGLSPGVHGEGHWRVAVSDDGVTLADGTIAGSVLPFNRHVANLARIAGHAPALAMASLNPARAIGVESSKGSLEVGKDADLVALDADFNVRLVLNRARIIYQASMRDSVWP